MADDLRLARGNQLRSAFEMIARLRKSSREALLDGRRLLRLYVRLRLDLVRLCLHLPEGLYDSHLPLTLTEHVRPEQPVQGSPGEHPKEPEARASSKRNRRSFREKPSRVLDLGCASRDGLGAGNGHDLLAVFPDFVEPVSP